MNDGKSHSNLSRLVMKAMGVFGGVKVVEMLCSIVRNKLVAMWIGPVGIALFAIYNQALEMINTATALDTRRSSVREISRAVVDGDEGFVARIVAVVRRWSLWLGLAGALITIALAQVLSHYNCGTTAWGFVALSIAVLLVTLSNGEQAVLQGLSRLNRLARVGLWGSLGGLAISVPLFYFLRERSIVPSIIAYAACGALAAWLLRERGLPKPRMTVRETAVAGAGFVKLGIFMTVGSFVAILIDFIFTAWLTHESLTVVGYYKAGYTLFTKYTGLVFTALGMEFYPRLASVVKSRLRVRAYVGQEILIALTVLAPVLALLIVLRGPVIELLYSSEFDCMATFVSWGLLGIIFKAVSWCMAFVILARGDGKMYLLVESLDALVGITLNIIFYKLWGLNGLGASFVVWYVIYTLIVAAVYLGRYRLRLAPAVPVAIAIVTMAVAAVMALMETGLWPVAAALTAALAVASLLILRRLWHH